MSSVADASPLISSPEKLSSLTNHGEAGDGLGDSIGATEQGAHEAGSVKEDKDTKEDTHGDTKSAKSDVVQHRSHPPGSFSADDSTGAGDEQHAACTSSGPGGARATVDDDKQRFKRSAVETRDLAILGVGAVGFQTGIGSPDVLPCMRKIANFTGGAHNQRPREDTAKCKRALPARSDTSLPAIRKYSSPSTGGKTAGFEAESGDALDASPGGSVMRRQTVSTLHPPTETDHLVLSPLSNAESRTSPSDLVSHAALVPLEPHTNMRFLAAPTQSGEMLPGSLAEMQGRSVGSSLYLVPRLCSSHISLPLLLAAKQHSLGLHLLTGEVSRPCARLSFSRSRAPSVVGSPNPGPKRALPKALERKLQMMREGGKREAAKERTEPTSDTRYEPYYLTPRMHKALASHGRCLKKVIARVLALLRLSVGRRRVASCVSL